MAIKVRGPGRELEYVLEEDRASSVQTKFRLRGLKWYEMDEVNALSPYTPEQALKTSAVFARARAEGRGPHQLTEDETAQVKATSPFDHAFVARLNRYYAEIVKRGLVGVENVIDEKGNPVKLAAADFIEHAETRHLHELGAQIVILSRHTEDEAKK